MGQKAAFLGLLGPEQGMGGSKIEKIIFFQNRSKNVLRGQFRVLNRLEVVLRHAEVGKRVKCWFEEKGPKRPILTEIAENPKIPILEGPYFSAVWFFWAAIFARSKSRRGTSRAQI